MNSEFMQADRLSDIRVLIIKNGDRQYQQKYQGLFFISNALFKISKIGSINRRIGR